MQTPRATLRSLLNMTQREHKKAISVINFLLFVSVGCIGTALVAGVFEYRTINSKNEVSELRENVDFAQGLIGLVESSYFADYSTLPILRTDCPYEGAAICNWKNAIVELTAHKYVARHYKLLADLKKWVRKGIYDEYTEEILKAYEGFITLEIEMENFVEEYKDGKEFKHEKYEEYQKKFQVSRINLEKTYLAFINVMNEDVQFIEDEIAATNNIKSKIFLYAFLMQVCVFLIYQFFEVSMLRRGSFHE